MLIELNLGDPDFWNNPWDMFLSKDYAKTRTIDINMKKHTPSKKVFSGNYNSKENTQTTHYSVVDKFGSAVAVTTTLNRLYGNRHIVEGAGFF